MFADPSLDDTQAIAQTLSGQRDAFEPLVERYLPVVRAYLLSRTGNVESAADIAQDTFVKAFRALSSFRAPDKFGPWLIAIARSASEKQPPPGTASGRNAGQEEAGAVLHEHVAALPEPLREVLILHSYAGSSPRDIGALLGISKWEAEKRLQRARRTLGDRQVDQFGASLRSCRVRREDVLAVMAVIRSVLVPRAGYTVPLAEAAPPSPRSSLPWLAAGVAMLALLIVMIWNAEVPTEDSERTAQARPPAARTAPQAPPEAKPSPRAGAQPTPVDAIKKRSVEADTESKVPAPITPASRKTPAEFGAAMNRAETWFALLPQQNAIRDQDDLFREDPTGAFTVYVSSWVRRLPAADYQLEIRNSNGAVLRGKIAYRPRLERPGSEIVAVDPIRFTEPQVRGLGNLEPGKYLMALMQDKKRVSNVAAVVVDPDYTNKEGQVLTIFALEPPGNGVPALGIQATGVDPQGGPFTRFAIDQAEVLIDGVERGPKGSVLDGSAGASPSGPYYALIRDIFNLEPPLALAAQTSVKVRVGQVLSNTITLPATYPDARAWDAGTSRLDSTPTSPVQLAGAVIGVDGSTGAGYVLKLTVKTDEAAKSYTERADTSGQYAFRSIPPGRYTLHCAHEGAELETTDIDIAEKETARLDINMERRYHFSGHVQDAQGNPVDNAKVSATWHDGDVATYRETAHSDAYGRYEVASPFSAVASVHAEKSGLTDATSPDGAEKHQGVLTGRSDIDIILAADEGRSRPGRDQQDAEPPASATQ
ncbi:MAG: carboxypeptidase regulatory-like domain-containing protein [Candidatus Hydrogenedentes bacterium]|nr:carboxypeptidase regulatory-like domain-containing protein [Candidatus Hydrogenedentota bacterium]